MSGDYEVQQLTARVMELESKVDFLMRHLGVTYVKTLNEGEQRVVDVMKKSGNMIEAIKVYREYFNVDLASAKKAVEDLKGQY
jgi:ribosomal protein L7/L12